MPLRRYGFVEEEFLFSGVAAPYGSDVVALAPAGVAVPVPLPYTTRMLVRRPRDPARFSGTVVVEWLNVTSGYDVDAAGGAIWREMVRSGHAWAGVTAQTVGTVGLKAFDPVRYATVAVPADQYAYDVFSQAARALRVRQGVAPLGPLRAQRVIATGTSQSGGTLNRYVSDVQPNVRPVFDGFLVLTSSAEVDGVRTPTIRVLTEREVGGTTEPDGRWFRQWEIAGSGHTDIEDSRWLVPQENREWSPAPGINWPLAPADLPNCLLSRVPKYLAIQAALAALDRWIRDGVPAPAAPRLRVRDGAIVRDRDGNATGGLRLPHVDVPTGAHYGEASNECTFTFGKTVPFGEGDLRRRYPSQASTRHGSGRPPTPPCGRAGCSPPTATSSWPRRRPGCWAAPDLTGSISSVTEFHPCRRCGRPIPPREGRGRPREFCAQRCRQAAYQDRVRNAETVEHALVVTRDELERLRDDLYVLACAVQDARSDLDDDTPDVERIVHDLLDAATPLIARGKAV